VIGLGGTKFIIANISFDLGLGNYFVKMAVSLIDGIDDSIEVIKIDKMRVQKNCYNDFD
jgi:hypothetical protein